MSTTSMIFVVKIRRFVVIKFVKLSDEQQNNKLAYTSFETCSKEGKIREKSDS